MCHTPIQEVRLWTGLVGLIQKSEPALNFGQVARLTVAMRGSDC